MYRKSLVARKQKPSPEAPWMSRIDPSNFPSTPPSRKRVINPYQVAEKRRFNKTSTGRKRLKVAFKSPPPEDIIDLTQGPDVSFVCRCNTINSPPVKLDSCVTTASKVTQGCDVVDLTKIHTFSEIRSEHSLFFEYDPRGKKLLHTDVGYCVDCTCPKEYCAEKVFGKVVRGYMEHLINKDGFEKFATETDIQKSYKRTYTELIHSKMIFNNISFANFNVRKFVPVPKCMKRSSLSDLINDVSMWKEQDQKEVVSWGPNDSQKEFEDLVNGEPTGEPLGYEIPPDLPPLLKAGDEDTPMSSSETYRDNQATDVAPMFVLMKKFISDIKG